MSIELLSSLLEDKVVAIVGPAQYMTNSNLGEEIDECDTIVRINRSYESIDKYGSDIGSRTDILYSCLIEKPANAGVLDLDEFKKRGIKYICAPPASDMKGISNTTMLHNLIDVEKVKKISQDIPVRVVDHQFHNQLARAVECRPNTGFMAIYDLLRFKPRVLKIYGFSFYLDGFIKGVKEGIKDEQNKTQEEFTLQCFNSKRHIQKNMWQFAKSTLLNNKDVEVDKTLYEILKMDILDREEFKKR
jgi:hypothetical protein|tara:strand:+ start:1078 stop:1815 length:738 start_codon:yes stop_codon:yes gene_type:complete